MPNERLRDALMASRLTPLNMATDLGVDPKTVERWITQGRIPYPRYRHAIAARVGESETYLWPDALPKERQEEADLSEIVRVYPHRAHVPADLWERLIRSAQDQIDILVYAGLFLLEQLPQLVDTFTAKANEGVRIRLLLGDPDCPAVAERGQEEGIDGAMASRIHNVLVLYKPLAEVPSVEFHLHKTTLYNSLYRFDSEMIVNPHVYGFAGALAPVLHLRKLGSGDLFNLYANSFTKVWASSQPAWPSRAD
jgi:hypothetical protein